MNKRIYLLLAVFLFGLGITAQQLPAQNFARRPEPAAGHANQDQATEQTSVEQRQAADPNRVQDAAGDLSSTDGDISVRDLKTARILSPRQKEKKGFFAAGVAARGQETASAPDKSIFAELAALDEDAEDISVRDLKTPPPGLPSKTKEDISEEPEAAVKTDASRDAAGPGKNIDKSLRTGGKAAEQPDGLFTGNKLTSEQDLKEAGNVDDLMKMVEPPGVEIFEDLGGEYTLGPTDVIEISVMRHPEVSGEYPVNKEGKIQYDFVGDLKITGLNKDEATKVIADALSEYIVSPEVTVKIIQYNSKIVYVVGEVFSPGKIYMRGDTIRVREALMQAGLPRLSGVTKKSHLIKPSNKGKPKKKYLNVYALLYEGDLRYNDVMEPGDVLYVPPTFLTRIMRAISPVAAPIGQAAGARVGVDTIGDTDGRNY
ncbi:MAG: polysaccharide biosynthesis/export family protein [Candidatus Omnitrophota bacterium]